MELRYRSVSLSLIVYSIPHGAYVPERDLVTVGCYVSGSDDDGLDE